MKSEVNIQMFGAFRDLEPSGALKMEVLFPISVTDLKTLLAHELSKKTTTINIKALLSTSAIATESQVFTEDDQITTPTSFALLPPVCGG